MIFLVYGGSGSGKSSFAEKLLSGFLTADKYYIATMALAEDDLEGQKKIARHRNMRAGKGFKTIEKPCNLDEIPEEIKKVGQDLGKVCAGNSASALLECLSNLCANEMFDAENGCQKSEDEVCEKILGEIKSLSSFFENLVIVSANVFEDGIDYDEATKAYIRALGKINCRLAEISDKVYEVLVGIPVELK